MAVMAAWVILTDDHRNDSVPTWFLSTKIHSYLPIQSSHYCLKARHLYLNDGICKNFDQSLAR